MEELLKEESKDVQELIAKYFSPSEWLKIPKSIRFRHLKMSRNYLKINEKWTDFIVNPMPKPEFMKEKEKKTVSKGLKRPITSKIKLPSKMSKLAPKSTPKLAPKSTSTLAPKSTSTVVEKRLPKRNVTRKNYFEDTEPDNDRYVYCDNCEEDYVDYCSKCGMLICLDNIIVPMGITDRARKTVPSGVLEIRKSTIHGLGVFAIKRIQKGVRMGPYEGYITKIEAKKGFAWKLKHGRVIDASDEKNSNYLRYVNCATNVSQQNLIAYQYKGELYYRTFRDILIGEELLVYYGPEFAENLEDIKRKFLERLSKDSKKRRRNIIASVASGIDPKKYFEPTEEESQPDFFTCKHCSIGLSTKEYRNTHERFCKFQPNKMKTMDVTNLFICTYCEAGIKTEELLISHEKRCPKNEETIQRKNGANNKNKNYKCDYCDYAATQKSPLTQHVKIIHKKDKAEVYHCNNCDFKTYHKNYLTKHKKRHEGYNSHRFACTSCSKGFMKRFELESHILTNHPENIHLITGEIKYCNLCTYKTLNATHLTKHMFTHTRDINKKYSCSECGYSTNNKNHLKQHILTHGKEQLYLCTECKKRFNQKNQLDAHIVSKHSKNDLLSKSVTNRTYTCDICKYKCTKRANFKNHLATHTGLKSFFCKECKQGFIEKHNLDSHILSKHKNNVLLIKTITSKIHSCHFCDYQTVWTTNIKTHLNTHLKKAYNMFQKKFEGISKGIYSTCKRYKINAPVGDQLEGSY